MHIRILIPLTVALAFSSCSDSAPLTCGAASYCTRIGDVYVLSRDPAATALAAHEAKAALQRFGGMFDHAPAVGTLRLTLNVPIPRYVAWRSHWQFNYDLEQASQRGEAGASADLGTSPTLETGPTGLKDPRSRAEAHSDDRREGILSHEICHMYALDFMKARPLSAAMGEVAAVSCETPEMLRSRIVRFRENLAHGRTFEWERFLGMNHPLKNSRELEEAVAKTLKKSPNVTLFTVDLDSDSGRNTDIYYSQAAAFASFWREKCPNRHVFSDLYPSIAAGERFSRWLSKRKSVCGPRTMEDFDREIREILVKV